MAEYEFVAIIDPDIGLDEKQSKDLVLDVLKKHKAKVTKEDFWWKKKLAYPIKKKREGIYIYLEIDAPTESISKIYAAFRLLEQVLRVLIIVKPHNTGKVLASK